VFNYKRFFWAMRKVKLPIDESALVLDVGSGGNPHPRADVLLDRLSGSEHRSGTPMLIDRAAVVGDATRLPFKDKAFDFVIASHILEHMPNPVVFLKELQRVGKAGYIETPNFICERFIPCKAHCLEVCLVQGVLQLHKKTSYLEDSFLGSLDFLNSDAEWANLYSNDPAMFHVRYLWKDEIKFKLHNPETSCDWVDEIYTNSTGTEEIIGKFRQRKSFFDWRYFGASIYESYQRYMRNKRLKDFDIFKILACPECKGDLQNTGLELHCAHCDIRYSASPHINFEKNLSSV
jgi:SAM-dependent methyltransferase